MSKGLVSVVVPVYNRQVYIAETLDSIVNQTYENLEVIVVNDGSTDDTLDILGLYTAKFPNIKIINQSNQGQVKARNNALRVAKGEFIAFIDSDDIWSLDKLEKQIPLFKGKIGMVYSGIQYINSKGKVIGEELCDQQIRFNVYEYLLVKNRMTGGTVVLTAEALNKVGFFDESFNAAENWDLWIRISRDYEVDFVNEALLKYRKHDGNMSGNDNLMLEATYKILEKYCKQVNSSSPHYKSCKIATANYHHRRGIYLTSLHKYAQARECFQLANEYIPNYLDSKKRILRSYLGKEVNIQVSKVAKFVRSIF